MYASNFREMAREALRGKWKKMAWLTFLAMLLGAGAVGSSRGMGFTSSEFEDLMEGQIPPEALTALIVFVSIVTFISLWTFFMGSFVHVGQVSMIGRMIDGETPRAGMLFPKGIYWKSVGLNFMRSLFIFLWSLLLIVPGVLAAYSYSMADYVLATHPEMSVMEALRESKRRMQGRRWRLFCLELSFIGWELLAFLPTWLLGMAGGMIAVSKLEYGMPADPGTILIFTGMTCIGGLISFIALLFVYAYLNTSVVIFFRNADRAGQWQADARDGEEYAQSAYGDGSFDPESHPQDDASSESTLSADESVAKDVFMQHKCSRQALMEAGLMDQYLLLKASPISEARWKRDYADALMRRFDRDAAALDDLLALAAEYGMTDLIDRMLSRIERHLRNQTLQDNEILNMCGRVLALLVSGRLDDDPGFVARKKEQISDMADRLQLRLQEQDAGGDWHKALSLIREMCD